MTGIEHGSSRAKLSREERTVLADLRALDRSCPDLDRLDRMLKQFNVFRVLRFADAEIRHSNMLAWLLQPEESHGLGDSFLREWLLRVMRDSAARSPVVLSLREIATRKFCEVKLTREWNFLDLLVSVTTDADETWVIAIENKLRARQGENQLAGYRRKVESAYPTARRTFVFLTENDEPPDDGAFLTAKHRQVFEVLSNCLKTRSKYGNHEALVLMRHYLKILEERCMENPKITELARKIYERHRRALDVIIQHRTEPVQLLTDAIAKRIRISAKRCAVIPLVTSNGYARLLPCQWDTRANRAGHEWGGTGSAYVLVEIGTRYTAHPWLEVVVSETPNKQWRTELYGLSQRNHFPIGRWNKGTKDEFMRIYSVKCPIKLEIDSLRDYDAKAGEIWRWCQAALQEPQFQEVIGLVGAHLKKLPKPKPTHRN